MKSRARVMLKIAALIESLPVVEQRIIASEVGRTYGGALSATERQARWRERRRNDAVYTKETLSSTPASTGVDLQPSTSCRRRVGSSSTGSKNLELESTSTTDQPPSTPRLHRVDVTVTPGFDDFWAAYPRKVAKQTAVAAWKRRAPVLAVVLAAIELQRASPAWLKDAGAFIPHPGTWLNGERWNDEVSPGNGHRARAINDPWKGKTHVGDAKL